MNGVIGEFLPLAVGIAISPLPIVAAILMLLSQRGRANSLGFLLGWTSGILLAVIVFTLLSSLIGETGEGSQPITGVVKIVLGALLLFVGVRQWRRRPRAGVAPPMPKWMTAIDSMTAAKAVGLAFVLVVVNPKNLMMSITAGVDIGTGALSAGGVVLAIAIFTVIAITTIAVPVVGSLIAGERIRPMLQAMRAWLVAHNAVVMSVLLLVLGVVNIGKGIASF